MLPNRIGALIPAYFSPTSSLFNTIISEKQAHPDVPIAVILNVTGSGPGTAANSSYTTLMDNLRTAGVIRLGYVETNYAEVPMTVVEQEIGRWWDFYNAGTALGSRRVSGIYFGHMSNQLANQSYYESLNTTAKITRGFNCSAGGAGINVPTSFLGNVADTVVVYEGLGKPLPQNYSLYDAANNNAIGLIPLGIASLDTGWMGQISAYAGWLYMTNDAGSNPYDTLPSYFGSFISELDVLGGGSGGAAAFDTFGIKKIYHTKSGGEEWYLNRSNFSSNDTRFQNEPSVTPNADGSYSMEGNAPDYFVRLEAWSPAYADTTQRLNARWFNVEITGYIKINTTYADAAGTYLCQWYTRGGHHGSADPCEGSAYKSRIWRTATNGFLRAGFVKEICHSDYTGNQGIVDDAVPFTGTGSYNRWLGIKFVVYNFDDAGTIRPKLEVYVDIDVQNSSGNLVINNNWKFLTSYVDRGDWCTTGTSCVNDCPQTTCTVHITPGGNTTSGSGNFNRNLVAWRTDGLNVRFDYLTAREIDPANPVGSTPPPPPPPGPTPSEPPSAFDAFGTRKVHATKSGGNEWNLAATPTSDSRFNITHSNSGTFTITNNADGSYRIANSTVAQKFLNVFQPNGFNAATTSTNANNHGTCAQQGYMQDSSDWRNVEMTGYFRVNAEFAAGTSEICLFARGARHITPTPNCEGSSMKGFLSPQGATRFSKEQYHSHYNDTTYTNQINASILSRWIGFKYIVYNQNVAGTNVVKQEIYIDNDETNTWIQVDQRTDAGGWGAGGLQCNGFTADQLIIWGGPIATFRLDNVSNIDFKKLSVREIDADAISQQPPPPQPPTSCGS